MLLILFRSDTRHHEFIFTEGFTTREPPKETLTPTSPFESDRQHSIALSAKFEAVPYFPSESKKTESWVYVVAVDDTQDSAHYLDLHSRSLSMDDKDDLAYRLPFQEFVKEKNVIGIAAEHVLCAFKIKRNLKYTYCEVEGKKTPDCDSFVIESEAISNPKAITTLKNNPDLQKALNSLVKEYNAKVGQEIDVAEPKPKLGEEAYNKILLRNAFFVMNRLEPLNQYTPQYYVFAGNQPESTKAFFKTASLKNASDLLFSSEAHICKHNSLFYKAVESGFWDKTIEQEQKSIEAFIQKAELAHTVKVVASTSEKKVDPGTLSRSRYLIHTEQRLQHMLLTPVEEDQVHNSEAESDSECGETLQLKRKFSEF